MINLWSPRLAQASSAAKAAGGGSLKMLREKKTQKNPYEIRKNL